jgi:transcriptional regulator with XRE-family HTH domain
MQIHIGKKIREVFESSGMSVSEFSRRIKTSRQNVYGIFKRSSVDTDLLMRIGKALNHDFFKYFTEPTVSMASEPAPHYGKKEKPKKITLQIEIDEDKQNEILKLALGDNAYTLLKDELK